VLSELGVKLTFPIRTNTNAIHGIRRPRSRSGFGRSHEDGVVRMGLNMLLEILGTLKGLAAELALVRLQGNMDPDM
jgi:hypothetical protein